MKRYTLLTLLLSLVTAYSQGQRKATPNPVTTYVNPLLGTATLWDPKDLGFVPTYRSWVPKFFQGHLCRTLWCN